MGLIQKEDVIALIMPRLNSAEQGSLEHQRLNSVLLSIEQLPELVSESLVKETTDVERKKLKDAEEKRLLVHLPFMPEKGMVLYDNYRLDKEWEKEVCR